MTINKTVSLIYFPPNVNYFSNAKYPNKILVNLIMELSKVPMGPLYNFYLTPKGSRQIISNKTILLNMEAIWQASGSLTYLTDILSSVTSAKLQGHLLNGS